MKCNSVMFEIKSLEQAISRFIFSRFRLPESKNISTLTQIQIIDYILKHDNEIVYQKDLEDILKLRRATVSGVLGTMEKNNLIKRVVDDKDTRTKKIILNPLMADDFKNSLKEIKHIEKTLIKGFSDEEIKIFIQVIKQMKKNIEYND